VTGAHQYAAIGRLQRKDVAGAHPIGVFGVFRHGSQHGLRTVGGRDACVDAFVGFDRHGESGAMFGAVVADHGWQIEPLAALTCERQTNQPAAIFGHEVDHLGGRVFGHEDDIAFVFTILDRPERPCARPPVRRPILLYLKYSY